MCEKVPANEDPAAIAAARRKMTSSPRAFGYRLQISDDRPIGVLGKSFQRYGAQIAL